MKYFITLISFLSFNYSFSQKLLQSSLVDDYGWEHLATNYDGLVSGITRDFSSETYYTDNNLLFKLDSDYNKVDAGYPNIFTGDGVKLIV
jgi:hypothetical protein